MEAELFKMSPTPSTLGWINEWQVLLLLRPHHVKLLLQEQLQPNCCIFSCSLLAHPSSNLSLTCSLICWLTSCQANLSLTPGINTHGFPIRSSLTSQAAPNMWEISATEPAHLDETVDVAERASALTRINDQ